jgi:GDPmannose 4,6-dehydratase
MRALITGITGMDGWHLAQHLLTDHWTVAGLVRGQRDREVPQGVHVVPGDLLDQSSLMNALIDVQPHVVFNLAAITSIGMTWRQPDITANVNGLGVLRMLEAIRTVNKDIKLVQASTADQFGPNDGTPLDEMSPFAPRTPYGVAKQYAHDACATYREAHGMHVSTLIMFNHSSPRHGTEFIVRKVTSNVARIKAEIFSHQHVRPLQLGKLDAVRDWGYAPDYVRAYPLAAAQQEPDDYVIATGVGHTVGDLVRIAFEADDLDWAMYTSFDHDIGRPVDVTTRIGNYAKAHSVLGWRPKVHFEDMILSMVLGEASWR